MKKIAGIIFVAVCWLLTWGLVTVGTIDRFLTVENLGWAAIVAVAILSVVFHYLFDWITTKRGAKIDKQIRNPQVQKEGVWLRLTLFLGLIGSGVRKLLSKSARQSGNENITSDDRKENN